MSTYALLNIIRMLFLLLAGFVGAVVAMGEAAHIWWFGAILGVGFASAVIVLDILLRQFTIRTFSHGTFGLLIGLLCAWLVTRVFFEAGWAEQFPLAGSIFNLAVFLGFGFIGVMLALRSKREEFSLLIPYVRFRQDALQDLPTLLDTNIIIDGRIPGICKAGFLGGSLVVPRFVLEELQKMADSTDDMKRSRGRRGLDQLKGLSVLNLNELALALKPIVSTGDELDLELIKEGRDDHQAVGYLADGTMIVVNHAKRFIGTMQTVVVAGAVQTSAGRLIFAELKK